MEIAIVSIRKDIEACYAIRHTVFVEEQGVSVELEIDEHDNTDAIHFLGTLDGEAVATARIVVFDGAAKIQRLAVLKKARGSGAGVQMIRYLISYARQRNGIDRLILDAQTYALGFYEKLGFVAEGEDFDDAGIPHRRMVLTL